MGGRDARLIEWTFAAIAVLLGLSVVAAVAYVVAVITGEG